MLVGKSPVSPPQPQFTQTLQNVQPWLKTCIFHQGMLSCKSRFSNPWFQSEGLQFLVRLSLENPTKGSFQSPNLLVAYCTFSEHPPGDAGWGRRDIFPNCSHSGNTATSVTCCWVELGGRQGNTNTWKRKPNHRAGARGSQASAWHPEGRTQPVCSGGSS